MASELHDPGSHPPRPGLVTMSAADPDRVPGTGAAVAVVDQDWTSAMVPDVRRLAPSFLVAGVLPLVAYGLLRPHMSSDAVALAAVLVFPLAEIAFERRRAGHFEPIGIIALIGISTGLTGAVILHGNDFLLKVRDSLVTGVFGAACLATLPFPRPIMYHLGRAFAAGGDPARRAEFDEMGTLPGVMRSFRAVTAVWGVGLVAEGVCRVVLALTLTTGVFLVAAQIIGAGVIGALLWWTVRFSRRSHERTQALLVHT